MDNLPNEILEKIFSWMTDSKEDNLSPYRLVSKRWNTQVVAFWRHHESPRPQVGSEETIKKFLNVMSSSIQGQVFPFKRIGFCNLANNKDFKAAKSLLSNYKDYIEDVHVVYKKEYGGRGPKEIHVQEKGLVSFLQCFDVSLMPNLRSLLLNYKWDKDFGLPILNLSNLRVLRLKGCSVPFEKVSDHIVGAAPNIKLLEMELSFPGLVIPGNPPDWPFLDQKYKRIEVIEMTVTLDFIDLSFIGLGVLELVEPLEYLASKLEEWKNIRMIGININAGVRRCRHVLRVRDLIQRIIDGQANYLVLLNVNIWPRVFKHHLKIPIMPKLEYLYLSFEHHLDVVDRIQGNPFAFLEMVSLQYYRDPCHVFRSAVLDTVKTFELHDVGPNEKTDFTPWHTIFPNLKSFSYFSNKAAFVDFSKRAEMNNLLNFAQLEFLITHMRMETLEVLRLKVGQRLPDNPRRKSTQVKHRGFLEILSGLDNFKKVIMGAKKAWEKGGDSGEASYWDQLEAQRRPSLVNMTGLQIFWLDYLIDDDFVRGVLLRMNPLKQINFRHHKDELSEEMLKKLKDYHDPLNERSLISQ